MSVTLDCQNTGLSVGMWAPKSAADKITTQFLKVSDLVLVEKKKKIRKHFDFTFSFMNGC